MSSSNRCLFFLWALMFLVFGSLANVWAQETFEDGFESGSGGLPTGWRVNSVVPFDEASWITDDPEFVRSGIGAMKLVNKNTDQNAHIYLNAALLAEHEKSWILEFYVKGEGEVSSALYLYGEDGNSYKTIDLKGESGESLIPVSDQGGEWTKCRFVIPGGLVPPEAASIRPAIIVRGTIYVDDLSLYEADHEPVAPKSPEAGDPSVRPNLVQVAQVTKTPQLDGVLSDGEYPVSFTGLIDNTNRSVYAKPNLVGMGRDSERLYLAVEIQMPPGMSLKPITTKRDDPALVSAQSAFYLLVRPDAKPDQQGFEAAYISVDPGGAIYDAWEKINWDAGMCERDASYQTTCEVKTSNQNGLYTVELSVPLKDLKIDPQNARQILCSFGFKLPETIVSWQMVGQWFDHPFAFGLIDLQPAETVVQIDSLGAMSRGQIAPVFSLHNMGKSESTFEARTMVAPPKMIGGKITGWVFSDFKKGAEMVGADKAFLQWHKEGSLAPGASVKVGETTPLKKPGFYVLENQVSINGEATFYQKLPFHYSEPIVVALSTFPSRELLRAQVTMDGSAPEERGFLTVTAKSSEGKNLWEKKYPVLDAAADVEIPLGSLQVGPNTLDFQLLAKDGSKASLLTKTFEKRDTPVWLKNRSGIAALEPNWAPLPWGPIKVKDNTLSVWGRDFQFVPGALFGGIVSQNKEILSAPAVFKYRTSGVDHPVTLSAPQFESIHPGRVVVVQDATTPDFQLTVRQTIEFDGMDAIELQVKALSSETIEGMWLELPLRTAELSTYTSREGSSGFGYAHGLFPLAMKEINQPRIISNLWIGNETAGLSYFTDNYKGWLIDSRKPRLEVQQEGKEGALLKIKFVNNPSTLPESTVMRFGLQPSPFRPKFADFRKWRWGDKPSAPVNLWYSSGQMWTANDIQHQPRSWKFLDDLCAEAKKRDLHPIFYICGFAISPWDWISRDVKFNVAHYEGTRYPEGSLIDETSKSKMNEDYAYFHEDWDLSPRKAALFDPPTREQVFVSAGTSWVDYAVYNIEQLLKRSTIQAFFFDISYPNTNYDALRGLAYQTEDGVTEGTNEFMAARDMWKRIYYVFGENRKSDSHPWIIGHSFASTAPLSSFYDGNVNGEEIKPQKALDFGRMTSQDLLRGEPIAKTEKEFLTNYSGAAYRAIFGPQFGPVNFILPQYAYLPELKTTANTRDMLAITFVHNNQLWNAYVETSVVYAFWDKVEIPFSMGDTEFHGYWDNGVIASPDGIKVSYWKKPGTEDYLVAVANWTEKATEAVVKLPKILLGSAKAVDMESRESVSPGDPWRVQIPAHDLRVFRIQTLAPDGTLVKSDETKGN